MHHTQGVQAAETSANNKQQSTDNEQLSYKIDSIISRTVPLCKMMDAPLVSQGIPCRALRASSMNSKLGANRGAMSAVSTSARENFRCWYRAAGFRLSGWLWTVKILSVHASKPRISQVCTLALTTK